MFSSSLQSLFNKIKKDCLSSDAYFFLFAVLLPFEGCKSLPGLKRMVLPIGIATSSPVRGLRPTPRLRGLTVKTPKPRSSMRSPRTRESFIAPKSASTTCSAFCFGTPVSSAKRLIISSFITFIFLRLQYGAPNSVRED